MRSIFLRALSLTLAFPIAFAAGPAAARKLDYAMPPSPAIADGLNFTIVPPVQAPEGEKPKGGLVAVANQRFLDDERRIGYRQDFGGGGVATGLLLGPLGVAANAKAIENANEREVAAMHGKFPFTPDELLRRAIAARSASGGAATEARLTPSLFVTRDASGNLIFWALLDVSIGEWHGRYNALMLGRVPMASVVQGLDAEALRNLEWGLQSAYAAALDTLAADAAGTLTGFAKGRVQIEAFSPRFSAMVKYDHVLRTEERVLVRALAPGKYVSGGMGFIGVMIVPLAEAKFPK